MGLVEHAVLVAKVPHPVGVPVHVPPAAAPDQVQLAEVPHPVLSVNVVHAVGVPVHAAPAESQTHPASRPHVLSLVSASEHTKVSVV